MGTEQRRLREKDLRRAQIMEAAKEAFTAKGFEGATMEDIASRAELSPAALYTYFDSKSQLYASLNLEMLAVLCREIEAVETEPGLSPPQRVRRLAQAMHTVYRHDPANLINVLHMQASPQLNHLTSQQQDEINRMATQGLRSMARIFAQGMDQGCFRRMHPTALADLVWAMFSGLVLWEDSKRLFTQDKDYLAPTLEAAMEILEQGIARADDAPERSQTCRS